MPLGTGSAWPTALDTDNTLGPTSGIVAGVTHLGDVGSGQGDQLGITKNLINSVIKLENVQQCGNFWCATNGAYSQPAIGSTVIVTVYAIPYGTAPFQTGMIVNVQPGLVGGLIGGLYLVTAIGSSTSITLLNLGGPQNNAAAGTIPTASVIQSVGWHGAYGLTDTVALWERTWENCQSAWITSSPISATTGNADADWYVTATGTGSSFSIDGTALDSTALNTPGLWQANTGTVSTNSVVASARNIFIPSLTALDITFSVEFPTLSTGNQTYNLAMGVSTSSTAPGSSPFMGIIYNQASSTAWQATTGATYTTNLTTTGITANAATLYHCRMTLNAGWTSMNVWINHAGPTTVSTNLQTGQVFPVWMMVATVGSSGKIANWARTKLRLYLPR